MLSDQQGEQNNENISSVYRGEVIYSQNNNEVNLCNIESSQHNKEVNKCNNDRRQADVDESGEKAENRGEDMLKEIAEARKTILEKLLQACNHDIAYIYSPSRTFPAIFMQQILLSSYYISITIMASLWVNMAGEVVTGL